MRTTRPGNSRGATAAKLSMSDRSAGLACSLHAIWLYAKLRNILDEATDKWGIRVNRVELKNIMPPRDIQDAMEKQMRAERERRQAILLAEGEKRSAILKAEGEKESAIRRAEGLREAQILEAEGQSRAIVMVQEARAQGLTMVFGAVKEVDPTPEVVAIRSMEALEKVAESPSSKLIVPTEAMSILGALSTAREVFTDGKTQDREAEKVKKDQ